MSTPKYTWWGYAKSMVRRYPDKVNEDEKRAVECAIEETQKLKTGARRMRIIQMVLMSGSHSLLGAATACYVSYRTAANYHADFIRLVGKNFKCESLLPPTSFARVSSSAVSSALVMASCSIR